MKHKALFSYLSIVIILSAAFIFVVKLLGQQGHFLVGLYMLVPAIAAIITRIFFHDKKFKDANLKLGKLKHWLFFWAIAIGITSLSYAIFTMLGAISWDFSGQTFLSQLSESEQMAPFGQEMTELPEGMTPFMMLILFAIGGLTVFSIMPGIIMGFGEEFGWRGLMFPALYKIKPWVAFIIGGLIWYAWHMPLGIVLPQTESFSILPSVFNYLFVGIATICNFIFLAYVYIKTESIWITSFTHIVLNNSAISFSYFASVTDQFMGNLGLMITMLIVVGVLYFKKEFIIFKEYFNKMRT